MAPRGRLFRALSFTIKRGKIVQIDVIADPERLGAHLQLRLTSEHTSLKASGFASLILLYSLATSLTCQGLSSFSSDAGRFAGRHAKRDRPRERRKIKPPQSTSSLRTDAGIKSQREVAVRQTYRKMMGTLK